MIKSLTLSQLNLLRRCRTGLRVWELGAELAAVLTQLQAFRELQLVTHDDDAGYELTPLGEDTLNRLDG